MKTTKKIIACAILTFSLNVEIQSQNIIPENIAGFEAEDNTSETNTPEWQFDGGKAGYFSRTTEEIHSGSAAMKLTIPGDEANTVTDGNYEALKKYVDTETDFILGIGGVHIAEYINDANLRNLINTNFMNITPGNAMKYASIVKKTGEMNFVELKEFLDLATANNISIYGHALCWHTQQTRAYLEGLIAPATKADFENKTTGGDCEANAATSFILNQSVPDVVIGFTEEGEGASGAADDRALKVENPTGTNANYKLALGIKLPAGTFFEEGKTYKVKFDMKADNAFASGLYVQVKKNGGAMQQSQEPLIASLGANIPVTTEWTTYEKNLTFPVGAKDKNGASIANLYHTAAFGFARAQNNTLYFDNISISVAESVQHDVEKTPAEKKEILLAEMDRWIEGMMTTCNGRVKVWDVVNEPIEDGANPTKLRTTPQATKNDPTINEFYWQDYLGENYVRDIIRLARKHGGDDLTLFINDFNLEKYQNGSNKKCKTLIKYVNQWESDGVTKIDGIATQMHIHYNTNAWEQSQLENSIVDMFELLAATGKLIKISELDMGLKNGNTTVYWEDTNIPNETHQKMAEFYTFIIEKYFEIIPPAQQYGITHWKPIDPLKGNGKGWKAGEPVGLWFNDYMNTDPKPAYGGFADGIISGFASVADTETAAVTLKRVPATFDRFEADDKVKVACWVYVPALENAKLNGVQFLLTRNQITTATIPNADISKGEWVRLESSEITTEAKEYGVGVKVVLNKANTDGLTMYIDDVEFVNSSTATSIASSNTTERLFVTTEKTGLRIIGAPYGALVEVFNVSGVRVAAETNTSNQQFIPMKSGIYIVRMCNQVKKVIM